MFLNNDNNYRFVYRITSVASLNSTVITVINKTIILTLHSYLFFFLYTIIITKNCSKISKIKSEIIHLFSKRSIIFRTIIISINRLNLLIFKVITKLKSPSDFSEFIWKSNISRIHTSYIFWQKTSCGVERDSTTLLESYRFNYTHTIPQNGIIRIRFCMILRARPVSPKSYVNRLVQMPVSPIEFLGSLKLRWQWTSWN